MSPFNEAKYKALLEGLEISEISASEVIGEPSGQRWDSEYFRKPILVAREQIHRHLVEFLGKLVTKIQHPIELKRIYSDSGLRILLAQEVRNNKLCLGRGRFMPEKARVTIAKNKLNRGDVVVTRSGANFGQSAPINLDLDVFACADLLVIRRGQVSGNYIATFLNTAQGRLLLDRGSYGMAQPHIAPAYLQTLPIPRFKKLEIRIDRLILDAQTDAGSSESHLLNAQEALMTGLDLENWLQPKDLTYQAHTSEVSNSGRLDAEFYSPEVKHLYRILSKNLTSIGSVSKLRKERFTPQREKAFKYIEISGITQDGLAEADEICGEAAPSRATWIVHPGDVVTSTVRPIRRLTAIISSEQDGHVCSSGFAVLTPTKVSSELLMTYLRLPPICYLMDLHTSASMYPAIAVKDILRLPFLHPGEDVDNEIKKLVEKARLARAESQSLLDRAKRAVEIAIEQNEEAALAYLDGKTYAVSTAVPELFAKGRHYVNTAMIRDHLKASGLSYEPETVNRYLHEWKEEGRIYDAGRGWYSDLAKPLEADPEPVRDSIEWMQARFPLLDFTVWSTEQIAEYGHHLLARHLTFLNVERDAIESVAAALHETGRLVYANPRGAEAKRFMPKERGIVLRPAIASDLAEEQHQLPLSLALVDLALECEWLSIIGTNEYETIFNRILSSRRVDVGSLIHRAKYRKTKLFGLIQRFTKE